MSGERWRFIDSGPRAGAENMALDEAMLEAHAAGRSSPTLRVYTWRPRAVSLGRFQGVKSSLDLTVCRELGIDVVRRPTGGRAILHTQEEVTFSVVVSTARLGTQRVMDCYRALAGGIIAGLRRVGVEARLVERERQADKAEDRRDPACFAVKARCDLVVGDCKLVGSAQTQREGVVLQQNSLPLRVHAEDWHEVFLRAGEAPEARGLWDVAGEQVEYSRMSAALREGFGEVFGVGWEEGDLSEWEVARARGLEEKVRVQAGEAPSGRQQIRRGTVL